jgi:aspartate aminotransferase
MKAGVELRLKALHAGLSRMKADGLPVDAIAPMGAIYLSARFALNGRQVSPGAPLETNEDIRSYLLESAGMAAVPFQAFGVTEETGWFRLSVGAVSVAEIEQMLPRLEGALAAVRQGAP